jgi:poly-gamma-glutamate capsule biosynthesis protein CapA/YwtB (metallophosphatase superfamily)
MPPKARGHRMKKRIDNNKIKLAFFGDMMLGGEFIGYSEKHSSDLLYPFKKVEDSFHDADICVMNLEGPLPAGKSKRSGVTSILQNHPGLLDYLQGKGTFILNLANNHIMDYGPDGLKATLDGLDARGIYHIGAGLDSEAASREVIVDRNGMRMGFVAYTSDEQNVGAVLAGPTSPGCASFTDINKVIYQVKKLKTCVDVVCVCMHWGHEYYLFPSFEQVTIAHMLADVGVDIIIGHHPHVIQGVEKFKNTLIMYSLGNFFLPAFRATSGRITYRKRVAKQFLIVECQIDSAKKKEYQCIGGAVSKDFSMKPFMGLEKDKFMAEIDSLSRPIGLKNYDHFWADYKKKRERELTKESLLEAFKKLLNMPFTDFVKTFTVKDVKRNIERLHKIVSK